MKIFYKFALPKKEDKYRDLFEFGEMKGNGPVAQLDRASR